MKRICIYIDGSNIYGGLNNLNKKFTDEKFDFEKYIKGLVGNNKLVCVYYYNGYSKKKLHPTVWERQNILFNRLKKLKKWEVILCRKQKCHNEDGTFYFRMKEDDISLAVNALSDAYENKFDKMILISSDSDMIPLIRQIKELKKDVEICYFKDCIRRGLLKLFKEENKNKITKNIIKKYFFKS